MAADTSDRPGPLIEIAPRGPYLVSGVETFVDADGRPCGAEPNMALCRCGHSGSKPFCDGAHVSHGFTGELRTVLHQSQEVGLDPHLRQLAVTDMPNDV